MERYDPSLIIDGDHTKSRVISYLKSVRGFHDAEIAVMTNVQLMNAYHDQAPAASEIQRATADAISSTLRAIGSNGGSFDEELVRYLARNEAQKLIDAIPPRRIEIVTATGSTIINGPVHYKTELVLKIAALGHAIMMVGPAGCGKTTIGEHVAKALNMRFSSLARLPIRTNC